MGQLTGTIHRFSTGSEKGDLSRFLSRSGTTSGQNRDKRKPQNSAILSNRDKFRDKFRDKDGRPGQTGTKGCKPCPVVPLRPALVWFAEIKQVWEALAHA